MEGIEIPSLFLCPISLQIMRDPVILSTGITYDRDSIEEWIFAGKHNNCPVTKQPLADADLTPNHTLRRLIQSWCTCHSSDGVERISTPRSPVDKAAIAELLEEAKLPRSQLDSLRKLRAIVSENERSRRCVEGTPGVANFLASIVSGYKPNPNRDDGKIIDDGLDSTSNACDEAVYIIQCIQISDEAYLDLFSKYPNMIESLTTILRRANRQSRACAMAILRSLLGVISQNRLTNVADELTREIVAVLRDRISDKSTKAALHALVGVLPWGRNRITGVESGAVHAIIEVLLDEPERRMCELALAVLHWLCSSAEGRAELVGHAGGVPSLSGKVLRVSQLASEKAVRTLHSVATCSATSVLLQEMAEAGVVSKLCLVLHSEDCTAKTKEKAREVLRLHSRVWKNSPCLSPEFKILYPS